MSRIVSEGRALTMGCDIASLAVPGVRALEPYQPGKPLAELERELGIRDAIKLASNENPLGPSPIALAAARAALDSCARYPDGGGVELKRRIAAATNVDVDQITLGNGSNDVLEFVARAFMQPQHEAIFSAHAFAVYDLATRAVGARSVVTPARNWGHDLDAMRKAVTPNTRVVFIANPNNPTGTWLSSDELAAFVSELPADVLIVVDEAYFEYVEQPAYGSAIAWIEPHPNLIVTRTFSKAYGLAGLRIGYAVSSPAVADMLNRVRQPFNVNSIALEAARAALDDTDHLRRSIELNRTGLQQLADGARALRLRYIPSAGNFLSIDLGRPADSVYQALLRAGVIVRPIANYGMPNHLRVTVGLPSENARFLQALTQTLGAIERT